MNALKAAATVVVTLAAIITAVIVLASIVFVSALPFAAISARRYEKITGKHVTAVDMLFLDMRIQAAPSATPAKR